MKRALVLIALLTGWVGLAKAVRYECPPSITTSQHNTSTNTEGWETTDDKDPHYLSNVGLYSGHPQEKAALVPDDPHVPEKSIWTLDPNAKLGYWIGCQYNNTSIVLAKSLETRADKCVAIYKVMPEDRHNRYFQYMECK